MQSYRTAFYLKPYEETRTSQIPLHNTYALESAVILLFSPFLYFVFLEINSRVKNFSKITLDRTGAILSLAGPN